jgi:DNA repair protein RecO (recombination protein O)
MNFSDQGIIISKKLLKERSYIITVFTKKHGIYSGVIKQYSKKLGDSICPGNLVDFFWSARLHEHIGYARAEPVKSYNSYLLMNKTKLYAFSSIISILKLAFCEREPHNNLFPALLDFLESIKVDFSFQQYIKLELAILAEAGYQLQLDSCAVTGANDDLYYVSPKSGRAVSKEAGRAYSDKLLRLPQFTIDRNDLDSTIINDALNLTSYFLNRYIFVNKAPPAARQNFFDHIMYN